MQQIEGIELRRRRGGGLVEGYGSLPFAWRGVKKEEEEVPEERGEGGGEKMMKKN